MLVWTAGILGFVAVLGLVAGGVALASLRKSLPDPVAEAGKGRDQTTVIYDRDGEVIYKLFAEQNRTDRSLDEIPLALRQAVVATEDKRFYEHAGVDPIGIARALVVDVIRGEKAQGGSTITQQYVKQAFVTDEKTLVRKVSEAMLAYEVTKRYSKDEVLELYLNTSYFGHGAYGVEAASQVFFGKTVGDLTVAECALLTGIIKSPGLYSPYLDAEAAVGRRDLVIGLMEAQGYLNAQEAAAAKAEPMTTVGLVKNTSRAPYFTDWVVKQLIDTYGEDRLYRGGLVVKTTLDVGAQDAAVAAVTGVLDQPDDPSAALVSLEVGTGRILAMVGGRDYATQQFNVAAQGDGRQAGSSFKPFVLATAFEEGVSPERSFESAGMSLPVPGGTWTVNGSSAGGPMRLRPATEQSINSVFAQLILEVGADKVVDLIGRLGIKREITPVPAIALGGLEEGVTPLDMATAYSTFANAGTYVEPYGIDEVSTQDGEVLFTHEPVNARGVSERVAYLITDFLRGVAQRGTATGGAFGRTFAAKTGTTQQYRDAWIIGYTPQIVTSVWMGYPDSQEEMTNVHGRRITGGSLPATIFARYMGAVHEGLEKKDFTRPKGLTDVEVCALSGQIPGEFCTERASGLVFSDTVLAPCELHKAPDQVAVPNVVGMTKSLALSTLSQAGFTQVGVGTGTFAEYLEGIVGAQNPAPGTLVAPDTPLSITVSDGVMPGASEDDAPPEEDTSPGSP